MITPFLICVVAVIAIIVCAVTASRNSSDDPSCIGSFFGLLLLLLLALGVGWWLFSQTPVGKNIANRPEAIHQTQLESQQSQPQEASSLFQQGGIDGARAAFSSMLKSDEGNFLAWNGYGDCLWWSYQRRQDINELVSAIRAYRKSVQINPDQAEIHLKLVSCIVYGLGVRIPGSGCTGPSYPMINAYNATKAFCERHVSYHDFCTEAKEHCFAALKLEPEGQLAQEASQLLDEISRKEGN